MNYSHSSCSRRRGFALLITLTIAALLVVLVVGLLQLTRSSIAGSAERARAAKLEASAIFAGRLALGALQSELGPDQVITAEAQLFDENAANSGWVGVFGYDEYQPNRWLEAQATAAKRKPNAFHALDLTGSNLSELDPGAAGGGSQGDSLFRRWLVSGLIDSDTQKNTGHLVNLNVDDSALLWPKANGAVALRAPYVALSDSVSANGMRYAWGARDETLRVSPQVSPYDASVAGMENLASVPVGSELGFLSGANTAFGWAEKVQQGDSYARLVSPATLELADAGRPELDRSSWNGIVGNGNTTLLTDSMRGGLRSDLSLHIQNDSEMTVEKGNVIAGQPVYKPQFFYGSTQSPANGSTNTNNGFPHPAAGANMGFVRQYLSWGHKTDKNLFPWENIDGRMLRQAEPLLSQGSRRILDMRSTASDLRQSDRNNTIYKYNGDPMINYRSPRMLRVSYILSYETVPSASASGQFDVRLVLDAMITLWNPFDVPIRIQRGMSHSTRTHAGPPLEINFEINGVAQGWKKLESFYERPKFFLDTTIVATNDIIIPPGGTVVCGPVGQALVDANTNINDLTNSEGPRWNRRARKYQPLVAGFATTGGMYTTRTSSSSNPITVPGTARIGVSVRPRAVAGETQSALVLNSVMRERYPFEDNSEQYIYRPRRQHDPTLGATLSASQLPSRTAVQARNTKIPFTAFFFERRDQTYGGNPWRFRGLTRTTDMGTVNSPRTRLDDVMAGRLVPLTSWGDPNLQIATDGTASGYYFTGRSTSAGVSRMVRVDVPEQSPTSLLSLRHAGLGDGSFLAGRIIGFNKNYCVHRQHNDKMYGGIRDYALAPWVDNALGNSWAHPMLPLGATQSTSEQAPLYQVSTRVTAYDQSFRLNRELADRYFLSGLDAADGLNRPGSLWNRPGSVEQSGRLLLNPRMRLWRANPNEAKSMLFDGSGAPTALAAELMATLFVVDGAFNVNCTSVEAWAAFLGSLRRNGSSVEMSDASGATVKRALTGTPVAAVSQPLAQAPKAGVQGEAARGLRVLTDDEVVELATEMVKEVRLRGPFLSRADFLNRRPVNDADYALSGVVQAAIDNTEINKDLAEASVGMQANTPSLTQHQYTTDSAAKTRAGSSNSEVYTAAGAPGWVTQADLLAPLEPLLTTRGDTFTVRIAVDSDGGGERWAELVCQRLPEYLNEESNLTTKTDSDPLTTRAENLPTAGSVNARFGRRMQIISWRWLTQDEIF